jgi:hypothetical protein
LPSFKGGSVMNRSDRRNMRGNAIKRLKSSEAYCLITYDGKSLPVFHFDMTACTDHDDARHCAMRAAAEAAVDKLSLFQAAVEKKTAEVEQAERVTEAKEKRSVELQRDPGNLVLCAEGIETLPDAIAEVERATAA